MDGKAGLDSVGHFTGGSSAAGLHRGRDADCRRTYHFCDPSDVVEIIAEVSRDENVVDKVPRL